MKVLFQLKHATESGQNIISALCKRAAGPWYLFSAEDRDPKRHSKRICELVEHETFSSTVHYEIDLAPDEQHLYINPEGKFWFKNRLLPERKNQLPKQLSLHEEPFDFDPTAACKPLKKKVKKESALNPQSQANSSDEPVKFIANGQAKIWLSKYEKFIKQNNDEDYSIDDALFGNLVFWLAEKDRIWFHGQEHANWHDFRKTFVSHFDDQFWKLAGEAVSSKHTANTPFGPFFQKKIDNLTAICPGLDDQFKIVLCLLSVSEENRKLMQNGISNGISSFLELAKGQDLRTVQVQADVRENNPVTRDEYNNLIAMLNEIRQNNNGRANNAPNNVRANNVVNNVVNNPPNNVANDQ